MRDRRFTATETSSEMSTPSSRFCVHVENPKPGSHLDLLILTVHKLLVAGSDRLSTLYHCFLTVLCNVSPYAKGLSLIASVKLLSLFELFTSPGLVYPQTP